MIASKPQTPQTPKKNDGQIGPTNGTQKLNPLYPTTFAVKKQTKSKQKAPGTTEQILEDKKFAKQQTKERKQQRKSKFEFQCDPILNSNQWKASNVSALLPALEDTIVKQTLRQVVVYNLVKELRSQEPNEWNTSRLEKISFNFQFLSEASDLLIQLEQAYLSQPAHAIKDYVLSIWGKITAYLDQAIPESIKTAYRTSSFVVRNLLFSSSFYKHILMAALYMILRYIGLTNMANIILGIYLSFLDGAWPKILGSFAMFLGFNGAKKDLDEYFYGPRSRVYHSGSLDINLQSDDFYQSPASSLATIGLLIGTLVFGLKIGDYLPADYEQFAKRMNAHAQVARGFSTIHDSFKFLISGIKETGCSLLGLDPNLEGTIPVDIRDNIAILQKYDSKRKSILHTRTDYIEEVVDGFEQWNDLRLKYARNRALTPILDKMQVAWVNLNALAQAHNRQSPSCRTVPVVVMFRGESGVGKSSLTYHIAAHVMAFCGKIRADMTDAEIAKKVNSCVYPRASEITHWEGYMNQIVTTIDDAFQERDSATKPNLDVMELIRMSNPFPMPMNMADLSAKGRTNFTSRAIIYTTNVRTLKFDSVYSQEAIQNRVHMPYELKIKKQFATSTGKLRDEFKTGKIDTNVYEFHKWDTKNGKITSEAVSYEDIVKELLQRMKKNADNSSSQKVDIVEHARQALETVDQFRDGIVQEGGEVTWEDIPEEEEEVTRPRRIMRSRSYRSLRGRGIPRVYSRRRAYGEGTSRSYESFHYQMDQFFFTGHVPRVDMSSEDDIEDEYHGLDLMEQQRPANRFSKWLPSWLFNQNVIAEGFSARDCLTRASFYAAKGDIPPLYSAYKDYLEGKDIPLGELNFLEYRNIFEEVNDELCVDILSQESSDLKTMEELKQMLADKLKIHTETIDNATLILGCLTMVSAIYSIVSFLQPKKVENEWWKEIAVLDEYPDREALSKALEACSADFERDGYVSGPNFKIIVAYLQWAKLNDKAVLESENFSMPTEVPCPPKFVPESGKDRKFVARPVFESGKDRKHVPTIRVEDESEIQPESGKDRKHVKKVELERYVPDVPLQYERLEAWCDNNAHQVALSIRKNVARMVVKINGEKLDLHCLALFVAGRDLMMNEHYMDQFMRLRDKGDVTITICNADNDDGVEYTLDEMFANFDRYVRGTNPTDLIICHLPSTKGNRYPTIVRHIIRSDQLKSLTGRRCAMTVKAREGWESKYGKVQKMETICQDGKVFADSIFVDIGSRGGDCGGYYIFDDPTINCKLFGFHFAGWMGGGICVPLVYEDIIKIVNPQIELNMDILPSECPEMLSGNCLYLGTVEKGVTVPSKSKLQRTKCFEQICETAMAPAKINYSEWEDGVLSKALSKQFANQPVIDHAILDKAVKSYRSMLTPLKVRDMKVLEFEEAVAGVQGDEYICGIERSTSSGFPYCVQTKNKGKTDWFGKDGPYDFSSDKCQELREIIKTQISDMASGKFVRYTFMNVLKDETRALAKVLLGKTRVFSGSSLDFLIVFRMYFMSFLAFMMENRIHNESAVGIRAQSTEWTVLAKYLKSVGNNVIAGDFSNYDGTLHSEILWKIYDLIEEYYSFGSNYDPVHAKIRKCLWENIVSSQAVVNKHIYQLNHSQPSGNPSTAILNSIYNSIACRYVYFAAGHSDFNSNVRMIAYGDDNILSVNPSLNWTQNDMTTFFKSIGMDYTDEEKTGISQSRTLEQVSFLKRGFGPQTYGLQFAPLKLDSILECFNWIHETHDEVSVIKQNWAMANMELSFHDRQTFDTWTHKIRTVLYRTYGFIPDLVPQDAYLLAIREGDKSLFSNVQWV